MGKNNINNLSNQEMLYDIRSFGRFDIIRYNKILKYLPKIDGLKILDVGCGECQFFDKLQNDRNYKFYGVDNSEKQLYKARKKGYHSTKSDLDKTLPFAEDCFDIVIATEIIEHLFDTDAFLQRIHRVLKPEGLLILTTPNIASIGARVRLLFGQRPNVIEAWNRAGETSGHIRAFDYSDIKKLLTENNYSIIKLTGREFLIPFTKKSSFKGIKILLSNMFPTLSSGFLAVAKKCP